MYCLNDIKDVDGDMTEKNRTNGGASMSNDYYDGEEDYGVENPLDSGEDSGDLEREKNLVEDDIPDVWWADDIRNITNPVLREREIEAAQKLLEEEKELLRKYEAGEMDEPTFVAKYQYELSSKMSRAATRSGLASINLTWDHLADLAEDSGFLAAGDTELLDQKDRLKEMIEKLGPDASQELADEMLEDGRISEAAHEIISRQVRLRRVSSK
jgi:hypothetical protein